MEGESLTAFSLDGDTKTTRLKILSQVIRATTVAGPQRFYALPRPSDPKTVWGICSGSFAGLDR